MTLQLSGQALILTIPRVAFGPGVANNGLWQITRAELDHAVDVFLYEHLSNRSQAVAEPR